MKRSCRTCAFHTGGGHEYGDGECRRRAPDKGEYAWRLVWPHTKATDWCGDYEIDADKGKRVIEASFKPGEFFYA